MPVGQDVSYEVEVTNRGSKEATNVDLVMMFSNGIEPVSADGLNNNIVPGQVQFETISQISPGDSIVLKITARADKEGNHIFRAKLTCKDSDTREIAEGTTKFYGDPSQDSSQ